MGWHRGRYFVWKIKKHGKVSSQYLGGGAVGRAAAADNAERRARRQAAAAALEAARQHGEARAAPLRELSALLDLLFQGTLIAAGYHQHARGPWRKCRVATPVPTAQLLREK